MSRTYNTLMASACALLILAGVLCIVYGASAADLRVPPPDAVQVDAIVSADALGECRDAALIAPGTTRVVRCAVDRAYPWPLSAQVQTGSPTLQAWIVRANGAFVDVALRTVAERTERASVRITLTMGVPVGSLGAPVAAAGRTPWWLAATDPAPRAAATRSTFFHLAARCAGGAGQGIPAAEAATPAAGTAGVI